MSDEHRKPTSQTSHASGGTSRAAQSGLDVLLSEAASGGAPRFIAPGSAVKVGAGLARHPRPGHRPRRRPHRRAHPHRRRTVRARARQGRPAVRRPRVGGQLAASAGAPGLPRGRRDRRRADHRRRRRLARRAARAARRQQRARRARPDELRVVQPDRAQGDRRHGRGQSRPGRRGISSTIFDTPPRLPGDRRHERSSRSGATSRPRRGRSCSGPRCSS